MKITLEFESWEEHEAYVAHRAVNDVMQEGGSGVTDTPPFCL
jgi:hypothetical protein